MIVRRCLAPLAILATTIVLSAPAVAFAQQERPGQPGAQDDERPGRGQGRGQARGGRQVDPSRITERLMQSDENGDGKITREEAGEGRFAQFFAQADADGDDALTAEEITVFLAARRGGGQAPRGQRPGAGGADQATPAEARPVDPRAAFDDGMSLAGRGLRGLRRTKFDETSFEADLAAVTTVESGMLAARPHLSAVPMSDAAKAKFGDDTKAYERAFRAHIVRSLMNCFELELAILEGDSAKAKTLATRLVEGRNASHDLFEQ